MFTFLAILACSTIFGAQSVEYNQTIGDDPVVLGLHDYLDICEEKNWVIDIDENSGSGLLVNVTTMNLEADNEAYLVVSTDETFSGTNSSVLYLSGMLDNLTMAVPFTQKVYIKYSSGIPCNDSQDFQLWLHWYMETVHNGPTEPPDTKPPADATTETVVHFAGKTLEEFNDADFQQRLKAILTKLAVEFCIDNGVPYVIKPSNDTVFFGEAATCPEGWHDYETCVKVWMAVYVSRRNTEYELTPVHLREFWKVIEQYGLINGEISAYEFPSISAEIGWWVLWVFIAVLVSGIAGMILWAIEKRSLILKSDETTTDAPYTPRIIEGVTYRNPIRQPKIQRISIHQKIPKFMTRNTDNESGTTTPTGSKMAALRSIFGFKSSSDEQSTSNGIKSEWKVAHQVPPFIYDNDAFQPDGDDDDEDDSEQQI